jgi:hypothetical protein
MGVLRCVYDTDALSGSPSTRPILDVIFVDIMTAIEASHSAPPAGVKWKVWELIHFLRNLSPSPRETASRANLAAKTRAIRRVANLGGSLTRLLGKSFKLKPQSPASGSRKGPLLRMTTPGNDAGAGRKNTPRDGAAKTAVVVVTDSETSSTSAAVDGCITSPAVGGDKSNPSLRLKSALKPPGSANTSTGGDMTRNHSVSIHNHESNHNESNNHESNNFSPALGVPASSEPLTAVPETQPRPLEHTDQQDTDSHSLRAQGGSQGPLQTVIEI